MKIGKLPKGKDVLPLPHIFKGKLAVYFRECNPTCNMDCFVDILVLTIGIKHPSPNMGLGLHVGGPTTQFLWLMIPEVSHLNDVSYQHPTSDRDKDLAWTFQRCSSTPYSSWEAPKPRGASLCFFGGDYAKQNGLAKINHTKNIYIYIISWHIFYQKYISNN